jgi:hypothetical protein
MSATVTMSLAYSLHLADRRAEVAIEIRLAPRVNPGIPPVVLRRTTS